MPPKRSRRLSKTGLEKAGAAGVGEKPLVLPLGSIQGSFNMCWEAGRPLLCAQGMGARGRCQRVGEAEGGGKRKTLLGSANCSSGAHSTLQVMEPVPAAAGKERRDRTFAHGRGQEEGRLLDSLLLWLGPGSAGAG